MPMPIIVAPAYQSRREAGMVTIGIPAAIKFGPVV